MDIVPEAKTERFQMCFEKSTLDAVDEYGFCNRIRTRAETIRRLIHKGLEADNSQSEKGTASA